MSSSNKLTGDTNELAKSRNRAAAERTLTSWIQNCLVLITFGIGFERILKALKLSFPGNNLSINLELTRTISLITLALGIFLLILAIIQYLIEIKSLNQKDYLYKPLRFMSLSLVVGSVLLFALTALIAICIISWQ